jgi:hypothetical protein
MGKVLSDSNYFKFLTGLGKSFMEITSDAVALNFLFTCYHDFIKKGKPVANSTKTKTFVHNAIILADKLMFEYITFKWRGSSDGKISKNISTFSGLNDKFTMIDDQSWINLFKAINDNYEIDDSDITFGLSKSLIYHTYSIMGYTCPSASSFDIDHIIPQALFDSSSIPKSNLIKNALFNLCPLPTKTNVRKNDKKLKDITDNWLIGQIETFSNIKSKDFSKFSDVQNWQDLKKVRRVIFEKQFIDSRKKILND